MAVWSIQCSLCACICISHTLLSLSLYRVKMKMFHPYSCVIRVVVVCMCVHYTLYTTIGHRNSLISIFLFIFATFQLTACSQWDRVFRAENIVQPYYNFFRECTLCSILVPLMVNQLNNRKNEEKKSTKSGIQIFVWKLWAFKKKKKEIRAYLISVSCNPH